MLKNRQEIWVFAELMLFLAAWGLGVAAAVDDNRDRANGNAVGDVAVGGVATNTDFSGSPTNIK